MAHRSPPTPSARRPIARGLILPPIHTKTNPNHRPLAEPNAYASLVKALAKLSHINGGKSVHARAISLALETNLNLANSLIHFYAKSRGLFNYARKLFDGIPHRNVVTINSMISGFSRNGEFENGLGLFKQVLGGGFGSRVTVNYVTLLVLVSGCVENGVFQVGKSLHSYCCKVGLDFVTEVCNVLIDLYSKFRVMGDAERLFGGMVCTDLVSWNTMIAGYARSGDGFRRGFCLFREMRFRGVGLDAVSLVNLILACANGRDLVLGKMVHGFIVVSGFDVTASLLTMLISMYSKCGLVEVARKVFDGMPDKDLACWNSMIHGYVECGRCSDAFVLFELMKSCKVEPDEVTMLSLISACRNSGELCHGTGIQSYVESRDHLKERVILQNALVDMFAKCGNMGLAKTVFDKIQIKDVFSWTSIIAGHAVNGEGEEALQAFRQMCAEKVKPNSVTFLVVLSACDHSGLVHVGQKFYNMMLKDYNMEPNIEHCGCIVDMLARAGKFEEVSKFMERMPMEPNAIIWRMLINACRIHKDVGLGLRLAGSISAATKSTSSEDHVTSSHIFAAAGRWEDVLHARGKTIKTAGTSFISSSID